MKTVFDSSIWVSAIKFGGAPLTALLHAIDHDSLVTCDELEVEVVRILKEKFIIDPLTIHEKLAPLLARADRVSITGTLTGICRDPTTTSSSNAPSPATQISSSPETKTCFRLSPSRASGFSPPETISPPSATTPSMCKSPPKPVNLV